MGFKEKMTSGDDTDIKKTAVNLCRGYLKGPWKRINAEDISVEKLCGGLSNFLFLVRLVKNVSSPKQVLLRFYGQTEREDAMESLITDSVIFTLLSERKLGPKLYGIFPGGRIEEYIQSSTFNHKDMCDPTLSLLVAEKMATVHTIDAPINKEASWLWDTINKWLNNLQESSENLSISEKYSVADLKVEAEWLRQHLKKIYSPIVFCHNDLQQGNILLKDDQSIVLIDFEYCAYNYRGFDLANHFIEWCYDYNKKDHPNFNVDKGNYPSPAQMHSFIEKYLSVMKENGAELKPDYDKTHAVLKEVKHYTLATHFLWGLWSALNSVFSQIPFGYKEYAEERFKRYYNLKNKILSKSMSNPEKNVSVKRKILEGES